MQSIKFRAWNKDGKFFRGECLDKYERLAILNSATFEIMQFTGLHDKNGKEIYEGDVVQFYMDGVGKDNGLQMRVVKWSPTITGFDPFNDYSQHCCDWSVDMKTVEIIGNIYENPALVETCNEFN